MFQQDIQTWRYTLIMGFIILLITSNSVKASTPSEGSDNEWSRVEVEKKIPAETYRIYKKLFRRDNFELIGKLMTFFLKEQGRGYRFELLSEDKYSIKSRTIQEGSILNIESIENQGFIFNGELTIKKGLTFDCQFRVKTRFIVGEKEDEVEGHSLIYYDAPEIIKGINTGYKLFTGQDLVAYKIADFLEALYIVLNNLNSLDIKEWRKLSRDQEYLNDLFFPVEFTEEEIRQVEDILIHIE